ncbi:hypothetical protein LY76DRAFT_250210 [Colletotrichum caudatum]|nr:hypothetical protein LY76DRAFT_250210 [Colletotrichum caudatum]
MFQSTTRLSARAWYAELLASRQPPRPKPVDIIRPSRFSNAQLNWRLTGQTSRPRARARKPRPSAVKVFVFRTRDVSGAKTLGCELATRVIRAKGCSQAHHLSRAEREGDWAFHSTSIWMHMNAWAITTRASSIKERICHRKTRKTVLARELTEVRVSVSGRARTETALSPPKQM